VQGVVTARFAIPAGDTFDGVVTLTTPLSETPIAAASAAVEAGGRTLVATFDKADLDNNLPAGDNVPLVAAVTVVRDGQQTALTSSARVSVVK
jgi:hypothetical protein